MPEYLIANVRIIDEIRANCKQSINTAEANLSKLSDSFKNEDRELENYKREHNIGRSPKPLTTISLIISIGVIAFLFIAEMRLNTKLLAPAMARGEEGGQAVALAVAILNVFVSFAAGYLFVKNIHHYRAFKRRISQIGLFIYTVFIIYLNGVMGAFRATAELAGKTKKWGQTVAEAVPGEQGNELLWFLGTVKFDVYPLILTFIGITFAIASLWDGYLFDDPYPGYGKVGKQREEDKKEINRIRQHLLTEVQGNEYTLGLGYRVKDLKVSTKIAGQPRVLSSDLNFKADVSYELFDVSSMARTIKPFNRM